MEAEESFNDILRALDQAINEADNPKNENYINRPKTVYDHIADLAGLEHKAGNVYVLKSNGKQFIRTKLGFQPEEVFNKGLQLTQLKVTQEQTVKAYNEIKKSEDNLLNELEVAKVELEKLKTKLELYMVSINKLTALKKELAIQVENLTIKNNRLTSENFDIKQNSNNSNVTVQTLKYNERKMTELVLRNKKLEKEIDRLEKNQNKYIIVPSKKW